MTGRGVLWRGGTQNGCHCPPWGESCPNVHTILLPASWFPANLREIPHRCHANSHLNLSMAPTKQAHLLLHRHVTSGPTCGSPNATPPSWTRQTSAPTCPRPSTASLLGAIQLPAHSTSVAFTPQSCSGVSYPNVTPGPGIQQ